MVRAARFIGSAPAVGAAILLIAPPAQAGSEPPA